MYFVIEFLTSLVIFSLYGFFTYQNITHYVLSHVSIRRKASFETSVSFSCKISAVPGTVNMSFTFGCHLLTMQHFLEIRTQLNIALFFCLPINLYSTSYFPISLSFPLLSILRIEFRFVLGCMFCIVLSDMAAELRTWLKHPDICTHEFLTHRNFGLYRKKITHPASR